MQGIVGWQNKRLHALINQLGIQPTEKAALVKEFSRTGSTSSKDLLMNEANQLIRHLENVAGNGGTESDAETLNRMRGKLLSMAHEMRWTVAGGKVDMARVNDWCRTYGTEKKELNGYNLKQLSKLLSQFRIVRDNFLAELNK